MADEEQKHRRLSAGGGAALLKAMFDVSSVMAGVVELLGDDYRFLMANRATTDVYGQPPGGLDGRSGRETGLPSHEVQGRMKFLQGVLEGGRTATSEYWFRFPGGREGWFLGAFSPLQGEASQVSFLIIDVTESRSAHMEAERQGARLGLALRATDLGLWEYDIKADRVDWDARMRLMFGVPLEGDIDFQTYANSIHPDDLPIVQAAYGAAIAGDNEGHYVVEHRIASAGANGSATWVRGAARVLFDADGRATHVIGTAQDISTQVAARERQDLLLAELNHRVKNNLAAVQAIAAQTMRGAGDDPSAFKAAFDSRIQSLARGHDLLTRNAWEVADLKDVIAVALEPFSIERFEVSGGGVAAPLSPEMAVNLVMVLNELATNAAKYGALSREGTVAIAWGVDEGRLTLVWRERGGPPVVRPARSGFGTRLTLSALAAYGGVVKLDFPAEGVECRMTAPLAT